MNGPSFLQCAHSKPHKSICALARHSKSASETVLQSETTGDEREENGTIMPISRTLTVPQVSSSEASIPVSSRRLTSSSEQCFLSPTHPHPILHWPNIIFIFVYYVPIPVYSKICITRTRLVMDRRVSLSLSSPRVLPLRPSNHWTYQPKTQALG